MTHEIRKDAEDRFQSFISKLVRVPKHEIEREERVYQQQRKAEKADRRTKNT